MCPECWHVSDWFMITFLHAFIGNTNCNTLVYIVQGDVGSAGERSCWSIAELSLGPQTARSSRNIVGTNY